MNKASQPKLKHSRSGRALKRPLTLKSSKLSHTEVSEITKNDRIASFEGSKLFSSQTDPHHRGDRYSQDIINQKSIQPAEQLFMSQAGGFGAKNTKKLNLKNFAKGASRSSQGANYQVNQEARGLKSDAIHTVSNFRAAGGLILVKDKINRRMSHSQQRFFKTHSGVGRGSNGEKARSVDHGGRSGVRNEAKIRILGGAENGTFGANIGRNSGSVGVKQCTRGYEFRSNGTISTKTVVGTKKFENSNNVKIAENREQYPSFLAQRAQSGRVIPFPATKTAQGQSGARIFEKKQNFQFFKLPQKETLNQTQTIPGRTNGQYLTQNNQFVVDDQLSETVLTKNQFSDDYRQKSHLGQMDQTSVVATTLRNFKMQKESSTSAQNRQSRSETANFDFGKTASNEDSRGFKFDKNHQDSLRSVFWKSEYKPVVISEHLKQPNPLTTSHYSKPIVKDRSVGRVRVLPPKPKNGSNGSNLAAKNQISPKENLVKNHQKRVEIRNNEVRETAGSEKSEGIHRGPVKLLKTQSVKHIGQHPKNAKKGEKMVSQDTQLVTQPTTDLAKFAKTVGSFYRNSNFSKITENSLLTQQGFVASESQGSQLGGLMSMQASKELTFRQKGDQTLNQPGFGIKLGIKTNEAREKLKPVINNLATTKNHQTVKLNHIIHKNATPNGPRKLKLDQESRTVPTEPKEVLTPSATTTNHYIMQRSDGETNKAQLTPKPVKGGSGQDRQKKYVVRVNLAQIGAERSSKGPEKEKQPQKVAIREKGQTAVGGGGNGGYDPLRAPAMVPLQIHHRRRVIDSSVEKNRVKRQSRNLEGQLGSNQAKEVLSHPNDYKNVQNYLHPVQNGYKIDQQSRQPIINKNLFGGYEASEETQNAPSQPLRHHLRPRVNAQILQATSSTPNLQLARSGQIRYSSTNQRARSLERASNPRPTTPHSTHSATPIDPPEMGHAAIPGTTATQIPPKYVLTSSQFSPQNLQNAQFQSDQFFENSQNPYQGALGTEEESQRIRRMIERIVEEERTGPTLMEILEKTEKEERGSIFPETHKSCSKLNLASNFALQGSKSSLKKCRSNQEFFSGGASAQPYGFLNGAGKAFSRSTGFKTSRPKTQKAKKMEKGFSLKRFKKGDKKGRKKGGGVKSVTGSAKKGRKGAGKGGNGVKSSGKKKKRIKVSGSKSQALMPEGGFEDDNGGLRRRRSGSKSRNDLSGVKSEKKRHSSDLAVLGKRRASRNVETAKKHLKPSKGGYLHESGSTKVLKIQKSELLENSKKTRKKAKRGISVPTKRPEKPSNPAGRSAKKKTRRTKKIQNKENLEEKPVDKTYVQIIDTELSSIHSKIDSIMAHLRLSSNTNNILGNQPTTSKNSQMVPAESREMVNQSHLAIAAPEEVRDSSRNQVLGPVKISRSIDLSRCRRQQTAPDGYNELIEGALEGQDELNDSKYEKMYRGSYNHFFKFKTKKKDKGGKDGKDRPPSAQKRPRKRKQSSKKASLKKKSKTKKKQKQVPYSLPLHYVDMQPKALLRNVRKGGSKRSEKANSRRKKFDIVYVNNLHLSSIELKKRQREKFLQHKKRMKALEMAECTFQPKIWKKKKKAKMERFHQTDGFLDRQRQGLGQMEAEGPSGIGFWGREGDFEGDEIFEIEESQQLGPSLINYQKFKQRGSGTLIQPDR